MGDAAGPGASDETAGLAPEHAARRRWMSVLAKASAAELEQAAAAVREKLGALPPIA